MGCCPSRKSEPEKSENSYELYEYLQTIAVIEDCIKPIESKNRESKKYVISQLKQIIRDVFGHSGSDINIENVLEYQLNYLRKASEIVEKKLIPRETLNINGVKHMLAEINRKIDDFETQVKTRVLSNGKSIPVLGLDTYKAGEAGDVYRVVKDAIEAGYRHIDCAFSYGNEDEIGNAIKEMIDSKKVKREDMFITSKVWLTYTRRDRVIKCLQKSLTDLKLEYLDLYLIHWPHSFAQQDEDLYPKDSEGNVIEGKVDICETWKAMEDLVTKGLTKSIGISNFNIDQTERVLKSAKTKPVMNQLEVHPYLTQKKLTDFCRTNGIAVTAYSPLVGQTIPLNQTQKNILEDPIVKNLAEKYNKTVRQILIRFAIDRDLCVVPKSLSKARLISNIHVFDFKLSPEDINQLENLECHYRTCYMNRSPNVIHFKEYPFKSTQF